MNIKSLKKGGFGLMLGLAVAAGFSSCDKAFEEINVDPNNSSETSTPFLLTNAQREMMDLTWDEWWNGRRGNQLAQYWSSNQYSNESRYQFRITITNDYWSLFYSRCLKDLDKIIELNTADPSSYSAYGANANQIAIAKILKTWMYQNMTDCWGAIPYTQALKSAEFTTPSYDSQEAIYNDMLAKLNEAIAAIDVNDTKIAGDIVYNGNMGMWKKFANSLKMRVALRMSDVNSAVAQTAIQEAVASGVMTSNADNALFQYLAAQPNINPLAEDYIERNDFAASNIMVDMLSGLNDPRISAFYAPTVLDPNVFIGEVYGLSEANANLTKNDSVSQRSAQVLANDAPGVYLDYAQVEFMLAEAVERGYITGSAETHYNNAVTASMNFWGITDAAAISNYLAQADVAYSTATGTWKEKIGKQKWIALYNQGIQGWTEWRRLDFGILQAPADGSLDATSIPNRMRYPLDEQTLNATSYTEAVATQGADNQDTKLWWDVN